MKHLLLIFAFLINFSSCDKKNEKVVPDACLQYEERTYDPETARDPWAGRERFYRMDPQELCEKVTDIYGQVEHADEPAEVKLVISPHAGWQYSGIVTAAALARIQIPDLIILLGSNHKDAGPVFSVWNTLPWAIPFGDIPVDVDLANRFLDAVAVFNADTLAHEREHSIEVQLPWLFHMNPNIRIVPIAVDNMYNTDQLADIAVQMAQVLGELEEPYLVLASTDMTHYQPVDVLEEKDLPLLEKMVQRDPDGLKQLRSELGSNMCGLEPVMLGIHLANELGATEGELVMYRTSADTNNDTQSAVGYGSVLLW